jgi:hypothetical protein
MSGAELATLTEKQLVVLAYHNLSAMSTWMDDCLDGMQATRVCPACRWQRECDAAWDGCKAAIAEIRRRKGG